MTAYESRHLTASTESGFQALRMVVASAGLLPPDRLTATDRHLTLLARAEWNRLTHQAGACPGVRATGVAAGQRWLDSALIRANRWLRSTFDASLATDAPLR